MDPVNIPAKFEVGRVVCAWVACRCPRHTYRIRKAPATRVTLTRTTNSRSSRCRLTNTRKSSKISNTPDAETTPVASCTVCKLNASFKCFDLKDVLLHVGAAGPKNLGWEFKRPSCSLYVLCSFPFSRSLLA